MKTAIEVKVKKRVKGEARKRTQDRKATINEDGQEVLDETPLFVELGQKPDETMDQKIRRITAQVNAETAAKLAAQNMSEEDVQRILDEENNFEIPDEFEAQMTVYEAQGLVADLEETVSIEEETPPSPPPLAPAPEPVPDPVTLPLEGDLTPPVIAPSE